jgi:ATP-dependent exoDNAse (exonuclease V) beta subunit
VLSADDPLTVAKLVKDLVDLKRLHPKARTMPERFERRTDIDFVEAVDAFARWHASTPGEPSTARLIDDLHALSSFYAGAFARRPGFRDLWRLAHPPQLASMVSASSNLSPYRRKTNWKAKCGPDLGERLNAEAERLFAGIDELYRDLLGQIADGLVSHLSDALDDAVAAYTRRKREAAALDFDDLLLRAHELVTEHEPVRVALGERYRHIFVDEFQDTDPTQAAIVFLIAAQERPAQWHQARLRPGALFLVGDPKQGIYRFRGADIEAYGEARRAIAAQGANSIIEVTANFRSQETIIEHVNRCFEPVLAATGQPGYVKLSATLPSASHGLPCAATVLVDLPPASSAAVQRDAEAVIVAQICRRLIGAVQIERADGSKGWLAPGDIALLAPTGTELWRYERALEKVGLSVASQAGKTLVLQQETQDILALMRCLTDPRDTLAFGAFLRGPMVGLTDEELLDIAEAVHQSAAEGEPGRMFNLHTPLDTVSHPLARSVLAALQQLRRRVAATTPRVLLAEAIEKLHLRVVLAARHRNRGARALANLDVLIEMARPYDVMGLSAFVRDLQSDWEAHRQRAEGRIDASADAVEIVTIHSSKGLEWPVVIPINTSTTFRATPQFLHRQSDNTLHWVIGGITPPALEAAREEEKHQESLQRERMWYVACTRSRDLLIIPNLPAAPSQSWFKILDLGQQSLPQLKLDDLPAPIARSPQAIANGQTAEQFKREADAVTAAAPPIAWRRPSDSDPDRAEALAPVARSISEAYEYLEPIGAGRHRGILLHKLMEEFLTGELADKEIAAVEQRAAHLLNQLLGWDEAVPATLPSPAEIARTALNTLSLPDVVRLRAQLVPEVPIWSSESEAMLLAGRADALAVADGRITAALDWKSDIAPTGEDRARHAGQLRDYLRATNAPGGALIYMSLGEVVWIRATTQGDQAGA